MLDWTEIYVIEFVALQAQSKQSIPGQTADQHPVSSKWAMNEYCNYLELLHVHRCLDPRRMFREVGVERRDVDICSHFPVFSSNFWTIPRHDENSIQVGSEW